MHLSVFSPFYGEHNEYIMEAYSGLVAQTHSDWEWVVAPHSGAIIPEAMRSDPRVKIHPFDGEVLNEDGVPLIGKLKRFCCERCSGDAYVELDTDDILLPQCLEQVDSALRAGGGFAYSNSARFVDGTWGDPQAYGKAYGWQFRDFVRGEYGLKEVVAWPPTPQSMRLIMWAPNHVRAWEKSCYWRIGGHNAYLPGADDHDLVCRTFIDQGSQGMRHLDCCLYLYRERSGENTCKKWVQSIQEQSWANYHRHFPKMMRRWSDDKGLASVDLGEHKATRPFRTCVDLAEADVCADLRQTWPFADGSVGMVRAHHLLEHLPDKAKTMAELHRVLAPGGWATIEVPSTEGTGAFADPTHVSYWNEAAFRYWCDEAKAKFLPDELRGPRFQCVYADTCEPSWGKVDGVKVTRIDLLALKPGYQERPAGLVLI